MWFQWAGSHMTLEPCMKSHCWRERKDGHQLPPGFGEGESYCLHPERNLEVQVTFDRSIRDAFFPLIWIPLLWKISIVPFSDFFYAPSAGLLYLKQFSPDIHAWFSPPFCFLVTWGSQSARECHLCEEMGKENLMLIKQPFAFDSSCTVCFCLPGVLPDSLRFAHFTSPYIMPTVEG